MNNQLEFTSIVMDSNNCLIGVEQIRESIESDYAGSSEALYWDKRLSGNYKSIESYRSFTKRAKVYSKKKRSTDRLAFKRSKKWYGYEDKYMNYDEYMYEHESLSRHNATGKRVFCVCCSKVKYLFETQKQADNFIKYNSSDIRAQHGYAPVRSYECPICGGWHVTSQAESIGECAPSHIERVLLKGMVVEPIVASAPNTLNESAVEGESCIMTEEEQIKVMLKEIKSKFNTKMESFFDAYRNEDLDSCKKILQEQRALFSSFDLEYSEISKIKKRIASAEENVKILEKRLAEQENAKQKMIWFIQQRFREEVCRFNHACALRKLSECYDIFITLSTAIGQCQLELPFLKALRSKLANMEAKLNNLEVLLMHSGKIESAVQMQPCMLKSAI